MTIRYRTTGPWGAGIPADLTAAQADENIYTLKQEIDAKPDTVAVISIAGISQVGQNLFVTLTDATVHGPFPIPQGIQGIQGVTGAAGADGADAPPVTFGAPITDSREMAATDKNKYFDVNKNALVLITLVQDDDYIPGDVITFEDIGGFGIEIVEGTDVLVNVPAGFQRLSRGQFSQIFALYKGGHQWSLGGDLALI